MAHLHETTVQAGEGLEKKINELCLTKNPNIGTRGRENMQALNFLSE